MIKTFNEWMNESENLKISIWDKKLGIKIYSPSLDESIKLSLASWNTNNHKKFNALGISFSMQDFGQGYEIKQVNIAKLIIPKIKNVINLIENVYKNNIDLFKKYNLVLTQTNPSKNNVGVFAVTNKNHHPNSSVDISKEDENIFSKIIDETNKQILLELFKLVNE